MLKISDFDLTCMTGKELFELSTWAQELQRRIAAEVEDRDRLNHEQTSNLQYLPEDDPYPLITLCDSLDLYLKTHPSPEELYEVIDTNNEDYSDG